MSPGYDKIDYGKGAFDEDGGYHRYDADFSKDFCIDDKPGSDRSEIRDGNDDRNVFIDPALRTGYRIAEGLEYPCLDKIYFNYVVVNLVDNAIKYGGTHPVVKVDFYTIGDNYVLTVEDNGMGIAPKDQKQIFKQFYRVKNQQVTQTTGFGLGLTFVHKVVCAYGGSIRLESELGIGSKFTITIPQ